MNFIVLDLEFNQFFDFPHTKTTSNPRCPAEIIQIGAVKLNESLNLIDSKDFFVRPQIYTKMHPYVEKITGLKIEFLKKAPFFTEALEKFIQYIGNEKTIFCIWGPDDMKELYKNILFYSKNDHRLSKDYINVQKMANTYLKNTHTSIGLKAAAEAFNLEINRAFHNALNDALYTAEILKIITNNKIDMELLNIQTVNINQLKQSILSKTHEINMKPLFDFAVSKFRQKLSEKDKAAILSIYEAGRLGRFDIYPQKDNISEENGDM